MKRSRRRKPEWLRKRTWEGGVRKFWQTSTRIKGMRKEPDYDPRQLCMFVPRSDGSIGIPIAFFRPIKRPFRGYPNLDEFA